MSNTTQLREAIRGANRYGVIGPNVIANALPYVGGGLVLTAAGTYGGLSVLATNPGLFYPTFWVAFILEIILFFVANGVAQRGNNKVALPLLATYSLLTGYTLTGLIFVALKTSGVGIAGIGFAALGCGLTFIVARPIGSNLSDRDGLALSRTIGLGVFALLVVVFVQLILGLFHIYTPSWLEIGISGIGVFLFIGAAVADFYILPRTFRNEQYLPAALSMYLTYINLFIFILRLLIALNSDRR